MIVSWPRRALRAGGVYLFFRDVFPDLVQAVQRGVRVGRDPAEAQVRLSVARGRLTVIQCTPP